VEILLVDDETVIHRAVGTFLSRCGYSIEVANNGAEALHKVVAETPDVIISDIKMPVMDGLQLLERLKVCTPATPVILITGHGHMDSAVAALHEGAFAYLRKPINLDELLATLERIKENKRLESARAQRLATVGTLAAGVAHEINNPNTLVRANLQTFVCIQDNGPGVEQTITDKIFDPFFTTKMPGQGTGLGLSICHRIVTEHGGNISCSSHSGQGALFCVRLPPAKAQTIAASA
jgi:YesN/AraC family two-component response regulator